MIRQAWPSWAMVCPVSTGMPADAQLSATGAVMAGSASQASYTRLARPSRTALRDCFTPMTFS